MDRRNFAGGRERVLATAPVVSQIPGGAVRAEIQTSSTVLRFVEIQLENIWFSNSHGIFAIAQPIVLPTVSPILSSAGLPALA